MKVLKTPEENHQVIDGNSIVNVEVPCKQIPYYTGTADACGALLQIEEKDIEWIDYVDKGFLGRFPDTDEILYFAFCGHCKRRVYLGDTGGHLEKGYLNRIQAERIKSMKPQYKA